MSPRDATVALRRFGLGPRQGELGRIAADPRGFVLAQLGHKQGAQFTDAELEPSHVTFTTAQEAQRAQNEARRKAAEQLRQLELLQAQGVAAEPVPVTPPMPQQPPQPNVIPRPKVAAVTRPLGNADLPRPMEMRREAYQAEATARFIQAVSSDAPLLERLVCFWSNHFCVSINKGPVRGIAGAFEREAIRPHVLGRFADMLKAVEQHPAMLIFLDNQISFGPNSRAGLNQKRGLNENLAREILELHTLGVDGGYSQQDVTNLARIITGWSHGNLNDGPLSGKFMYRPNTHEPGSWPVLAVSYADKGGDTGLMVLEAVARHPATARHIARKLAMYFVGDAAPQSLIERLARRFQDSDGDLAAVTRVLIESPEAWQAPPRKLLPPYDWLVAVMRGLGWQPKGNEAMRLCAALGQPIWAVPSPAGWPDADAAWAAPAAIRERLRIAEKVSREIDRMMDPRSVARDLLGESLSEASRTTIAGAQSREQALEILMMTPEFQRR